MTTVTVIIVVLVVLALAAAGYAMYQKQRSNQLQQRFGPEYDRVVEGADSRRQAEAHLAGVANRRDKLDVRELDETERAQFSSRWDVVQAKFVDQPGEAVDEAESLISTVMRERGYPVDDFEQRAELVAADHPDVVQHYREAHAAHERHRSAGGVDTEDLRQSFVHYRALFTTLVHPDAPAPAAVATNRGVTDRHDVTDDDVTSDDVTNGDVTDGDVTGDDGTRRTTDPEAGPGHQVTDGEVVANDRTEDARTTTYPQETR